MFCWQQSVLVHEWPDVERHLQLRQAFAADQFTVHYQPQRDLATGQVVGVGQSVVRVAQAGDVEGAERSVFVPDAGA